MLASELGERVLETIKIVYCRNIIANVESLYFLSLCDNLTELILEGNENVISAPDYRRTVKELLPNLKKLDGEPFSDGIFFLSVGNALTILNIL